MIENVASIVVFVRVAETLSFTSAATQLSMSGPAASKAIARLERRMGVRLFQRTTRRVALTDDGQAFLERCRRILEDVQEAEEVLTTRRLTLRGRLRVQMPLGFGRHVILPALPELLNAYPELAVDFHRGRLCGGDCGIPHVQCNSSRPVPDRRREIADARFRHADAQGGD